MALSASLNFYFSYKLSGAGVSGLAADITVSIKKCTRGSSPTITTVVTGGSITVGSVTQVDGTNNPGEYTIGVSGLDPAADYIARAHYTGTSSNVDDVDLDALQSEFSASINAGAVPQVSSGANGGLPTVDASNNVHGLAQRTCTDASVIGTSTLTQTLVSGYAGPILTDNSTGLVTANATKINGIAPTMGASLTFPTSLASPTNITAGTITTVTNLTNAPTSGDFTTAMKTSLGTAVGTPQTGDGYGYMVSNLGALGANATALAPASTALSTVTWTSTIASHIDVAVSSRMATYTQPTGFLATVFAGTVGTSTFAAGGSVNTTQWGGGSLPTAFAANNLPIDYLSSGEQAALATAASASSSAATSGSAIYARLGAPAGASIAADIATRSTYAGGAVASVTAPVALTSAYDAAKTAAQPGDAMSLTTAERTAVANVLLDLANGIETSVTVRQALRLIAAGIGGDLSGAATTAVIIKAAGNSGTTRMAGTVDANGNRSSIVLTL